MVLSLAQSMLRRWSVKACSKIASNFETGICTKADSNSCRPLFLAITSRSSRVRDIRFRFLKFLFFRWPWDLTFRFLSGFMEKGLKLTLEEILPILYSLSLSPRG